MFYGTGNIMHVGNIPHNIVSPQNIVMDVNNVMLYGLALHIVVIVFHILGEVG